jgi:hypothetical protein
MLHNTTSCCLLTVADAIPHCPPSFKRMLLKRMLHNTTSCCLLTVADAIPHCPPSFQRMLHNTTGCCCGNACIYHPFNLVSSLLCWL